MNHTMALARLVHFYTTLSEESVSEVSRIYASDAHFKDPFNEVQGHAAIVQIFEHMFVQVRAPRFTVHSQIAQGDEAFLTWDFRFHMRRFSGLEQCVRGATHLRFDGAGRVVLHRDYWDAAEELYEKLPVLGGMMRFLKNKARH